MTVQYQGVWSLQSAAQLQSTQRWVTDPLYKNTTLLLQADDAANGAQNNTFLDSSSNSFIITRNGNTTQGSFTPFSQSPGWWGNYFDGSSGISTADSADFTFGSGNFTIQCWVFSTVGGSLQWLAGQGASNAANTSISFAIQKTANNKLNPSVFTGGTQYQITSTGDLLANQWVHIAFVRDGNTCRLYINGVQDGTVSVTGVTVNDSSNQVAIGQLGEYVTNRYTGYVSNFSIIKGTCSYPSGATFTVPASPLSASANFHTLAFSPHGVQVPIRSGSGAGGPLRNGISASGSGTQLRPRHRRQRTSATAQARQKLRRPPARIGCSTQGLGCTTW